MATLGTDAVRHGAALKEEFAAGVRRYLELFAELMPSKGSRGRREAIATLSALIGALTLSRACAGADDALADEVLAAVRDELVGRGGAKRKTIERGPAYNKWPLRVAFVRR